MRFTWLDNWYENAWRAFLRSGEKEWCHGTADFWDVALKAAGHESTTLLQNNEPDIIDAAKQFDSEVICVQNVGLWQPHLLKARGFRGKCVAFCSYAAERQNLHGWDCVFTSFQWLQKRLQADGQRSVWLPLAFGRPVLDRVKQPAKRDLDVTFVGGLGGRIWNQGTVNLAGIAHRLGDRFQWWGYKIERLPECLEMSYQGEAWGADYYDILMRSKIVINRHGEIAKGEEFQNMRGYEATSCGAFVLCDNTKYRPGVAKYEDPDDACDKIHALLERPISLAEEAERGKIFTLQYDCYEHRVNQFLDLIESL